MRYVFRTCRGTGKKKIGDSGREVETKSAESAPEAICVCCPGCGSGDAEAVTDTRDFELAEDRGAFSVVKCRGCGLSYTSLRPRFDVLYSRHYPSNYLCYGRQGSAGQAALDRMRRAKQAAVRADLLSRLLGKDRKKRVLEIGCATGEFLEVCRDRHGYEVEGIEPDAQLADRLCKKGIEVQASSLEQAVLSERRYDAICLFNVLEHLWDPHASLCRLNQAAAEGGMLLAEIPCFEATGRTVFGKYWFLYHLPRHLTHFSRTSLATLAARSGFASEILFKHVFRPTVNALSLKYAARENLGSWAGWLCGESNPLMLGVAVVLELAWFAGGTPGTMMCAYRKTESLPMSVSGYLRDPFESSTIGDV